MVFEGKSVEVIKRHIAFHDLPKILCGREKVGKFRWLHSLYCTNCVCPINVNLQGFCTILPTGTSLVMVELRGSHGHRGNAPPCHSSISAVADPCARFEGAEG